MIGLPPVTDETSCASQPPRRTRDARDVSYRTVPGPVPDNVHNGPRPLDFETIVATREDLEAHLPAWEELIRDCIEPNIFYEPCVVLPALRHLDRASRLQFVMVYGKDRGAPNRPPKLCGFFPLMYRRFSHGTPMASWVMWGHANCFLRTPLIRNEMGHPVLETFFDWLENQRERLVEFQQVSAEGDWHKLLTNVVHRRQYLSWVTEGFARALLVREGMADDYLRAAVTGKHLKELRRQENRLADQGALTYHCTGSEEGLKECAEEFLAIEASGWKGAEATAFNSTESGRRFFHELVEQAAKRGNLQMLSLKLNDRTIASKCNLYTGSKAFAFKIGFDEQFAKYSPGVLLEIENVRRFFEQEEAGTMDSCADPHHPMINRLWKDRKSIQSLLVSTGGLGDIGLSTSPMLRLIKRSIFGRRKLQPQ